jgi:hypothetical protein
VSESDRSRKDGNISLLAIILIAFGIIIPVVLMIFVWKIISKSDPYDSDRDHGGGGDGA